MNTAKPLGELLGRWLDDPALASVEIGGVNIDRSRVVAGDLFFT